MALPTILFSWAEDPGALVTYPPTALIDLGWPNGEQPTAANMNAMFNNIGLWVQYLNDFFPLADGNFTANQVTWYESPNLDGLYLNNAGGGYGATIQTYNDRLLGLIAQDASLVDHIFQIDPVSSKIICTEITILDMDKGGIDAAGTPVCSWAQNGVQFRVYDGIACGKNALSDLRFAYDDHIALPVFTYDYTPLQGNFVPRAPLNDYIDIEDGSGLGYFTANSAAFATLSAAARTIRFRCPVSFHAEVGGATGIYTLTSLVVELQNTTWSGNNPTTTVTLVSRNRSSWVSSTIASVSSNATTFTVLTDTVVETLTPETHTYYLQVSATSCISDIPSPGAAPVPKSFVEIKQILLTIEKTAVE